MKICLVAGSMDWSAEGGAETYFSYLARLLARRHEVTVWTQQPPPSGLQFEYEVISPTAPAMHISGVPEILHPLVHSYAHSKWVAETLHGRRFDVIEAADWGYWTCLLRPLFNEFEVEFDKLAVSLHGILSRSFKLDWLPRFSAPVYEQVIALEHLQLATADLRIAMGRPYAAHWERRTGRRVEIILPATPLIELDAPNGSVSDPPDVLGVARQQRYKGGELLVQALAGVDRKLFGRAMLIGRDQEIAAGRTANEEIRRAAEAAGFGDVEFCESLPRPELIRRFSKRPLCVFPSLFDTFNFTALEAVMCGCPVLVGRTCGIAAFFEDAPAEFRPAIFEPDDLPALSKLITDALRNIGEQRQKSLRMRDWVRSFVTPDSILESVERAYSADFDQNRRYPELQALARLGQSFDTAPPPQAGGNGVAMLRQLANSSGDYDRAIALFEEHAAKFEQNAEAHFWYGISLLYRRRDCAGAIRHFNRVWELGYDEFSIRHHRGAAYLQMGDLINARQDLARAHWLQPENCDTRLCLERCLDRLYA